ncbi:MAG: tRNA (N6-isopentenyl adenosine(37)-C2)-methylthiotransferase MiaB [Nitrospirota bacterium]
MKSFHIITFGCQMNEHDSERMSGILQSQGLVPAATVDDAEMVILNTCSIREKAEQKFYSELGRLAHLKGRDGKRITIAVAGCIAQQEGKKLLSRTPSVDLVIGPSDIARLSDMVAQQKDGGRPVVETGGDPEYHHKPVPVARTDGLKAWVSIMYGCDNFCTYCVVPYLRGRERSRLPRDIVAEIQGLADRGYREITFLGQNVNSYGKGLESACSFPALLRLAQEVDGIERIRFVTSHPRDLSEGLISAIRDLPKVCESIHLPVQSGSDRVLASMNRRYTSDEYRDKVQRLRNVVPSVSLTTDIIVGFPGEGDEDFAMTLQILQDVQFDTIFAFKYSKRPNTRALDLPKHVPEKVKEERLEQVFSLQKDITLLKNRRHVGTLQEVLVEGESRKGGTLTGRTRGNMAVNFAGTRHLKGSLVKVRITAAGPNSLSGELCE